ncbi:MAG: four-carbon acid sugar kinase family protein [Planctomycetota bacterium]
MIAVIADDFSGAAEVAGWAVASGFTATLRRDFAADSDADVVVFDTDSRSLPVDVAANRLSILAASLRAQGVHRVFKKIDSVLRGHVAAEADALRRGLGRVRALIVPANPRRHRIVRAGHYSIANQPLHETLFAHDTDFPARTDRVIELLQPFSGSTIATSPVECAEWPAAELICGDACSVEDLAIWSNRLDCDTLPVGAAEFFAAWLSSQVVSSDIAPSSFRPHPSSVSETELQSAALPDSQDRQLGVPEDDADCRDAACRDASDGPVSVASRRPHVPNGVTEQAPRTLLVCGSPAAWFQGRAADARARGFTVTRWTLGAMTHGSANDTRLTDDTRVADAIETLAARGRLLVTCYEDDPVSSNAATTEQLLRALGEFARRILAPLLAATHPHDGGPLVERLLVEGGATTAALIERLGWNRFVALSPVAEGITPLVPAISTSAGHEASTPRFTLFSKPGSYAWPADLW